MFHCECFCRVHCFRAKLLVQYCSKLRRCPDPMLVSGTARKQHNAARRGTLVEGKQRKTYSFPLVLLCVFFCVVFGNRWLWVWFRARPSVVVLPAARCAPATAFLPVRYERTSHPSIHPSVHPSTHLWLVKRPGLLGACVPDSIVSVCHPTTPPVCFFIERYTISVRKVAISISRRSPAGLKPSPSHAR